MNGIGSYEERRTDFDWEIARSELDWQPGEILNIGHICSDRICRRGHADRIALIWEGELFFDVEREPRVEEFDVFSAGPEDRSVIHYTSGTTGQPKGAQHVHSSIWSQALTAKWVLDLREDDVYWFVGRDDDVINTGGHLVGPFEIESALIEHEAIAEAAVIGKPDPVNMEVVKAVVTLNPGYEAGDGFELEVMNFIRKKLSPLAMPQEIEVTDKLPRTRSGKILRRYLRALEWGEEVGDLSTLEED